MTKNAVSAGDSDSTESELATSGSAKFSMDTHKRHCLFSGTEVLQTRTGQGHQLKVTAVVVRTGENSLLARISNFGSFQFAPPPPPKLSGRILFAPPDARVIFLHNDLLCNGTCSVAGGGHNVLGGAQTEKIPNFFY